MIQRLLMPPPVLQITLFPWSVHFVLSCTVSQFSFLVLPLQRLMNKYLHDTAALIRQHHKLPTEIHAQPTDETGHCETEHACHPQVILFLAALAQISIFAFPIHQCPIHTTAILKGCQSLHHLFHKGDCTNFILTKASTAPVKQEKITK
jgi:hypothetical protein